MKYNIKIYMIVLFFCFSASKSHAENYASLIEENAIICSKQEKDEDRLSCYDKMASFIKKVQDIRKEKNIENLNNWRILKKKSPMDDSKSFIAIVDSKENIKDNSPSLILRCSENRTSAFINWGFFIDAGDSTRIQYRIDTEKAITENWGLSTTNKATFAPEPIKFIKKLSGAKQLLVRSYPYNKSPQLVTYDLNGIDQIIKELQETCSWK